MDTAIPYKGTKYSLSRENMVKIRTRRVLEEEKTHQTGLK